MHIKEIELVNFKSFGRRAVIPLRNDFIAVMEVENSGRAVPKATTVAPMTNSETPRTLAKWTALSVIALAP